MKKKIIKKTACIVLAATITMTGADALCESQNISCPSVIVAEAATVTNMLPIVCYHTKNENCTTYTTSALSQTAGYICAWDKCTIRQIYSNGAVQVTYPVKGGTRTAYAKTSDFFGNVDWSQKTGKFGTNMTAYAKASGNETIGTIFSDDKVCIITTDKGRTQILYPTSSGYKLGWVNGTYSISNENSSNHNNSLGSPVPVGCKFNKKTNDNGWYGYHDINIGVSEGTPVYALSDGVVTYKQAYRTYNGTKYLTSYGNFIEFTSSDRMYSAKYCHLNRFVGAKQIISSSNTKRISGNNGIYNCGNKTVKKGEIIGYIGKTGNASGVHLHFELRKNGTRIDPVSVISGLK